MMHFDFIVQATQGKILQIGENTHFEQIEIDSRSHFIHEKTVFFCFSGTEHNAHEFIPFLYQKKGVRCFVGTENMPLSNCPNASFIQVSDVKKALQNLAKAYRQLFNIPIIAITGSNGKTIVKEWLNEILQEEWMIVRSPKSYNSQIGVPLSILLLNNTHNLGIFEAGISEPGEMQILADIIQAKIGIFTTISQAHAENFSSLQEKIKEKIKLFAASEVIIFNIDQSEVAACIQEAYPKKRKFTYGFHASADVRIVSSVFEKKGSRIVFIYQNQEHNIWLAFQDLISLKNSYCVLACVLYLNAFERVKNRFPYLSPLAMRMELIEGEENSLLINDAYTADWQALKLSLDYLFQFTEYPKKTLILGDFLQNTQNEAQLYQDIAELLRQRGIDQFMGIGPKMLHYQSYFKDINATFYASREQAMMHIKNQDFKNHVILIKGARILHLEKIAHFLQKKKHETWLEIRMDALAHNLKYFKSLVSKNAKPVKLMAMVKARAYGSSEIETAQFLQQKGVDYFGVAFESEGLELRKHQISRPIMVMHAAAERILEQKEYSLEPVIYSFAHLEKYLDKIKEYQIQAFPIHLKIDTGMHRMGFLPEEINQLLQFLQVHGHFFELKSIYTHLAAAEEPSLDAFTLSQIAAFEKAKMLFKPQYPHALFHILNSAGIQRFTAYAGDMIRLGIGLYGVGTAEHQEYLQEVISCKTRIVHIQTLEKGTLLGYGRKGEVLKKSKIATLPIGYADGVRRQLGNGKWSITLDGKPYKTIGNICMDFLMIDLEDLPAQIGDEVTIFGQHGRSIFEMAASLNTIPYEILTALSSRISRIFLKE